MIRLARFVPATVAIAVAVSGCGLFSSKDPRTLPAQLRTFKPTVNLKVMWRASVGKAEGFTFTPAMIDKRVYATGADGKLTAFDAASGRQLWRVEAAKRVSGGVGAVNDRVVVGTQKGELLTFDTNGKLLWKTELGAEILAPVTADAGTMVVRTADGHLLGLNVEDGKRKWNYQRVTPTLALRSSAPATVTRGAIFSGFPSGVVTALELSTGRVGWESTIAAPRGATELERIADVSSEPVVDGDQICAAAYQGRVGCLDIANGKSVWSRDISSSAGIAVDDKYLYVSEESGAVEALDKKTGASVWKQKRLTNRRLGTPLAYGNVVLVGDGFGFIHALSKEDGSFAGRVATDGSALSSPPQAENGVVLFQTANGGLYAVQVQ